jgi:hypothetical protein
LAPRSRRHAAVEPLGTSLPEDSITASRLAALALLLAAIAGVVPSCLLAQEEAKEEQQNRVWRIEGLRTGFCVQLLLDPTRLDVTIPSDTRLLRADSVQDLSPVLRALVSDQPEFAAWTPSTICLYYMETVDAGPFRVSERNPYKAPMIGVWALAAADAEGGARKDLALRLFTSSGRLERAGKLNGLDLSTVRSTIREVRDEDDADASAPPIGIRYEVKLGKTLLTWDGRKVGDSTQANGPVSSQWRADRRRGGPTIARLTLSPEWTKAMVGSLRVEGKDDFAVAIKASPIRFVGPAVLGGGGELVFGH